MKKIFLYIILMVITVSVFGQNIYVVTKTTDPNPFTDPYNFVDKACDPDMYGTLQWAIRKSNDDNAASVIHFNIPGNGPHEILLKDYLPQIKQPVTIDAETQPGYTAGNPVIILNGQNGVKTGFDAYKALTTIRGIHIKNFINNGINLYQSAYSRVMNCVITSVVNNENSEIPAIGIKVSSNYVSISGNTIMTREGTSGSLAPTYGIYFQGANYCTVGDPLSGESNIISGCGNAGIVVISGSYNKFCRNSIYGNDYAILISSGNEGILPPEIILYNNGTLSGTALPNSTVEIFGSTGPEDANEYLGSTVADGYGYWSIGVLSNYGYLAGIQIDNSNNSSALSDVILLSTEAEDCPFGLPCNLICNSSMGCPDGDDCGQEDPPMNWLRANGTPDWCENANNEDPCWCNSFNEPPDPGFIYFISGYNTPAISGHYSEGIMSVLTQNIIPNQQYELSFYTSFETNGFTLVFKFISMAQVQGYLPDDSGLIPFSNDVYGVCKTIFTQTFYSNQNEWIPITQLYTSDGQDLQFDAIWVYAITESGKQVEIGLDKISLRRTSVQDPASTAKTCYNTGETIELSVYDPGAFSYAWSGPGDWSSNISNPEITNADESNAGTYSVTVVDIYGCSFVSEVDVVVNDLSVYISSPLTSYPENEITVCPNIDFILTAHPNPIASQPFPYYFEWNTGYSETTYSTSDININGLQEATYSVTISDENNCQATGYFTVSYFPFTQIPVPANTGPYCNGEDIELTVENPNPDYQYLWEIPGWSENPSHLDPDYYSAVRPYAQNNICCEPDPYYLYNFSGDYIVTVMDQNGCTASAATYVYVVPDQSCLYTESNSPVCAGEDLTIYLNSETNPINALCSIEDSEIIIEGPNGTVDFELIYNTIYIHGLEYSDAGTYTVTINSPYNCSSVINYVDVSMFPKPWVSLDDIEGHYCINEPITITPTHSDFITDYYWSVDGGFIDNAPVVAIDLPGGTGGELNLYLTVTDINGCSASDAAVLDILEAFTFNVSTSVTSPVCSGGSFEISTDIPAMYLDDYNFHWYGPLGFDSEDQSISVENAQVENSGYYEVRVSNDYGCTNVGGVQVIVQDCAPPFNLTCQTIPVTCKMPFNGAVEINISGGQAPYLAQIYRYNNLLNSQSLGSDGIHVVDLEGIVPGNEPVVVKITDNLGSTQQFSIIEGLNYAWDLVLSNNNLYDNHNYENMVIGITDNFYNQKLNFYEDFSFTNCTIYTAVHNSTGYAATAWDIAIPNTVTFENTDILSGCPDRMWQGIMVNGTNDFQPQTEHANIDFQNSSVSDAVQAIKTNGGAVATVRNSEFYNNEYDIYIYDAENGSYQIYRNVFETNNLLKNQFKNPAAHVYMFKGRNITFTGNTFRNSMAFNVPGYDTQNRGTGINALLSSFVVTPMSSTLNTPLTPWSTNTFEGLYYGINAGISCTYAPKINYNTFTNNYRGVMLTAINSPVVIFNNFTNTVDIPPVTNTVGIPVNEEPETNVSYATYINSCTDFKVEENTVKGIQAGMYVYNTGDASGQLLYRNSFGDTPGSSTYNMYAGALVVGKNSNWDQIVPPITHTGLEVRCNNYTSVNYAISVKNGNMRKNQGANSTSTALLAGNQFHKYPLVNGMDYTVQIDAGYEEFNLGTYNYWQHDDDVTTDFYRELSVNISGVIPYTKTGVNFDENTCLSHYQSPIADDEFEDIMDDISVINTSLTSANQLYNKLVDNGDTKYMKSIAQGINKLNFREYAPILENDGYLSDEVFETLLDNYNSPKDVTTAVLISNSPLPVQIMEKVDSSSYLDASYKLLISAYQKGISARVLLEYRISDLEQEKAVKESQIINSAINNDSLPGIKDLVISYLDSDPDYNKLIKIYGLNMSKQDYSASLANLTNLRLMAATLQNGNLSKELMTYCDVQEVFIAATLDNYSLVAQKDMLLMAALDGSALYSATAQILYGLAADTVFAEYTPLPAEIVKPRKADINATITRDMFSPFINVFPNPANAYINVEYDFASLYDEGSDILLEKTGTSREENCEKGELSLYAEDGKLLQNFRLNAVKDSFTISIKDYIPGTYILIIKDCFGNSETVKITKYR